MRLSCEMQLCCLQLYLELEEQIRLAKFRYVVSFFRLPLFGPSFSLSD